MSEDDSFGPALPPGFKRSTTKTNQQQEDRKQISSPECERDVMKRIGPHIPPHLQPDSTSEASEEETACIGPSLPPHLRSSHGSSTSSAKNDMSSASQSKSHNSLSLIGPSLPPSLAKSKHSDDSDPETDLIGPCLPKGKSSSNVTNAESVIGPCLPPHLQGVSALSASGQDEDFDNDIIGPLPSEMTAGNSGTDFSVEFERRAQKMRDHLDGKSDSEGQPKRDSWMTELPDCLGQNIGLTARTFRVNAGPDMSDRSMWTDSPADRARKEKEGPSESKKPPTVGTTSRRDQQIRTELDSYNRKRGKESLLDMHQEKMKKKKKEEENKPQERRPFDRDLDLQANRFDDAQRKAIIKKSQNLNSRFGHGKDAQYL
ncbi:GPALPP motifs-containing protein 1-like [Ostrea edulis]|uniref:GPALPP motifs-containing protein 1-like n=1 Tax=Ostrea edulis TaxID=37623 RepID=UPI0024AF1DBD|nr:GPALPP motifs-containing protein 1-like [Ostrea edulis]